MSHAAAAWGGRYMFLSVEQGKLDRNFAPSKIRLAVQHVIRPRDGWSLNGNVHVGIVILSVYLHLRFFPRSVCCVNLCVL